MKTIGVREFRDQASALLASGETLAIERHGRPIGFYVPIKAVDRKAGKEAMDKFGALIEEILEQTGMTEDELAEAFTAGWPRSG